MSAKRLTALGHLADGLEAAEPTAVRNALDEYEAAIESVGTEESTTLAQVNAAKQNGINLADRETLDQFTKRLGQVALGRAGMLSNGASYLLAPEEVETDAVAASVRTHIENVQSYTEWQAAATSILENDTLPASLVFVVREPENDALLGVTETVTIDLYNVGDRDATELGVASSRDGSIQSDVPATLSAGDDVSLDVSVTFAEDRAYTIQLVAQSAEHDEDVRSSAVTLGVKSKGDIVALVSQKLRDLEQRVTSAAIPRGRQTSLRKKVSAARNSVKRARSHVERTKTKQADAQLETAQNQIGALVNSLRSGSEKPKNNLPQAFTVGTLEQSAAITTLLTSAQDASAE